ncbi:unnamed protein product [Rotaria socialis]|uniref:Uncharacterized protein n=2 Tax=Rotaria socialis TaxID=392032 RepID=A0A820TVJ5_9BILA|nr:unnamed protein product [Rotaria socialis]CAF3715380.1 unnamed protein product [Rotaria socialis]CAF4481459.1 unnamed protein product [Rotaria socialis]CAF4568222.1 unnamed protein product [Rotaria socialis]
MLNANQKLQLTRSMNSDTDQNSSRGEKKVSLITVREPLRLPTGHPIHVGFPEGLRGGGGGGFVGLIISCCRLIFCSNLCRNASWLMCQNSENCPYPCRGLCPQGTRAPAPPPTQDLPVTVAPAAV